MPREGRQEGGCVRSGMNESASEEAIVPETAEQVSPMPKAQRPWVGRSVWTDRMWAALGNGVKDERWFTATGRMQSSLLRDCSPRRQTGSGRAHPDEETTDWRAVCGRTARTVRRAGRAQLFPTPIPEALNEGNARSVGGCAREAGSIEPALLIHFDLHSRRSGEGRNPVWIMNPGRGPGCLVTTGCRLSPA